MIRQLYAIPIIMTSVNMARTYSTSINNLDFHKGVQLKKKKFKKKSVNIKLGRLSG